MRYVITLEGEDLREDVIQFVADVEHYGEVSSADNEEGTVIVVDKITIRGGEQ
jgi:hypothetical protein